MNDQEYWQGVEQCRERLWRIARMWLSDDSAAMDVVDEAVFRGWRACGRLRHPEYFTTWLTRILLNECSREKKRQDREQAVDQLPEQAWEDPDHLPLRAAVQALPEQLRAVILLPISSTVLCGRRQSCCGCRGARSTHGRKRR